MSVRRTMFEEKIYAAISYSLRSISPAVKAALAQVLKVEPVLLQHALYHSVIGKYEVGVLLSSKDLQLLVDDVVRDLHAKYFEFAQVA